jgi:hypothetical protein
MPITATPATIQPTGPPIDAAVVATAVNSVLISLVVELTSPKSFSKQDAIISIDESIVRGPTLNSYILRFCVQQDK